MPIITEKQSAESSSASHIASSHMGAPKDAANRKDIIITKTFIKIACNSQTDYGQYPTKLLPKYTSI